MADVGKNPKVDNGEVNPSELKEQNRDHVNLPDDNGEGTKVNESKEKEPTTVTVTKRKTRRKKIRVELIKEPAVEKRDEEAENRDIPYSPRVPTSPSESDIDKAADGSGQGEDRENKTQRQASDGLSEVQSSTSPTIQKKDYFGGRRPLTH